MAGTRHLTIKAMLAYLVLLPLFSIQAEARDGVPGAGGPPIIEAPRPGDPRPRADEVRFTPAGRPLTVRALNGFSTDATTGHFSHQRHHHDGGIVTVSSPWGEQLDIRFWLTPHGVSFEYDDDLVVRYRFDKDGTLLEIDAESPHGRATMPVGNRGQLARQGKLDFASFDLSAYQLIEQTFRARHSEAFLDGLREAQGVLEAGCALSVIQCAACIIGWAATVPALAAACIVGGVPTFGLACFAAILVHEASTYACAATCVQMVFDCRYQPQGEVIPDGCEPRD